MESYILNLIFVVPAPFLSGNGGFPPRHIPYYTLLAATNLNTLKNVSARIIDAYAEDLSLEKILACPEIENSEFVCVPYTHDHRDIEPEVVRELVKQIKSKFPQKKLVLYNRYSTELDLNKDFTEVDYLLEGDYERLFVEFVQNKDVQKRTRGLYYSAETDLLNFPDFDLLSMDLYRILPHRREGRTVYYSESAKGCHWGKCAYCQENMARLKGLKSFRSRTPKNIVDEIEYAINRYGASEIMFNNAQFQVDQNWLLEFEAELQKKQIKIKWSALSRADFLTPQIIAIFKRTGCTNILIGIESINENLCRVIDKNSSIKNIESGISELKKAGIGVTGSFLIGLPGETPRDALKNMQFALKNKIDFAQIFIAKWNDLSALLPYKDTGKILSEWHYAQYEFNGPVFVPHAYGSLAFMKFFQQICYLYFYCHPLTVMRMLRKIKEPSDFFRMCAGAMTLIRLNFRLSKFSAKRGEGT